MDRQACSHFGITFVCHDWIINLSMHIQSKSFVWVSCWRLRGVSNTRQSLDETESKRSESEFVAEIKLKDINSTHNWRLCRKEPVLEFKSIFIEKKNRMHPHNFLKHKTIKWLTCEVTCKDNAKFLLYLASTGQNKTLILKRVIWCHSAIMSKASNKLWSRKQIDLYLSGVEMNWSIVRGIELFWRRYECRFFP